jgi:M6 family metalloprotease-like protein
MTLTRISMKSAEKNLRKVVAILLLPLWVSYLNPASAAPYHGTLMLFEQPDHTKVHVRIWGDEFYQRVESLDGYPLIRNNEGWICYAVRNADYSEWQSTRVIYAGLSFEQAKVQFNLKSKHHKFPSLEKSIDLSKESIRKKREKVQRLPRFKTRMSREQIRPQSMARVKSKTEVKGIVILIDFSDSPASVAPDEVERFFNQNGYNNFTNNGSIRDYFLDISAGAFDYSNDVIGYYRAKNPKSYYDVPGLFGKSEELIEEALQWADKIYDFSQLSREENTVRAINFIYAGSSSLGWTQGLWPHMGGHFFFADGVELHPYNLTSLDGETYLAVVCHENGHMLFQWPDLYDYDGDSGGVGNFCLMANMGDSFNPVPPNAYFRSVEGWENVISLNDTTGTFSAISNSAQTTYYYRNVSKPHELFVIESRVRKGRSASLPDDGLMIWHIDQLGSNSNQQMTDSLHYAVSIEQADGKFELEKGFSAGAREDLFNSQNKGGFHDNSLPDARWWSGAPSHLFIHSISNVADTMTFKAGIVSSSIAAPVDLVAELMQEKISLSWTDHATNEKKFVIERRTDRGEFFEIANVSQNTTHYVDNGFDLVPLTDYTYRVYAAGDSLVSPLSNEATASTGLFAQKPFRGTPFTLPGKIEAEDFDSGGQRTSYFDLSNGNQSGLYRDEAVEISSITGDTEGYYIEMDKNEWTEYTTDVTEAGFYSFKFRIQALFKSSFTLNINERPENESIQIEKNNTEWQTVGFKEKIFLNKGTFTLRFAMRYGRVRVNAFTGFIDLPVRVFPNPVTDILYISHDDTSSLGIVTVQNIFGQILNIYKQGTSTLDLSTVTAGIYVVRLFDNKNKSYATFKVSKTD